MGKRPWVCTDRWGGWTGDHEYVQTGGGNGQETMGLYRQVGDGMGKRPWVCTDRWGGWTRDHGSIQTGGGGMDKRPRVYTDRWGGGDGQETMGLYRQVEWVGGKETIDLCRQVTTNSLEKDR